MQKQVIFEIAKIREMSFFRTARAALLSVFPFVLIGSFAKVATVALLAPDSFLSGIFGMELSQRFNSLCNGIYAMTGGLSGLLAAPYSAGYTAQFLRQNYKTAATTGFIAYLALCFQQAGQSHGFVFAYRLLGVQGILAGIMFGYVVGKLFLLSGEFWSKVEGREGADQQLPGSFRMLLPLFLALAFAIILNFAGSCLFKNGISQSQEMKAATSSFPSILWLGLLTSVGTWCGLFGPYTSSSFFDEASATKNLNYALAHHGDLTGVPYKLTTYSTYFTYAQLAGLGLLLALMFVSKRRNRRLLCWWCLIPVFFGYDSALNIGTPVLLNPLFLIPYVFVPQLNMVVVSAFYKLGILLPSVYPVWGGTPPVLRALIATNGSFAAFFVSLALVVMDAFIYCFFVKNAERAGELMNRLKGGQVDEK